MAGYTGNHKACGIAEKRIQSQILIIHHKASTP